MAHVSMVPGSKHATWLFVFLIAAVTFVIAGGSPAARDGRTIAEAQMQVTTEGMTLEEHRQRQIELSGWLARELPAAALEAAVRVGLTPDEIDAVERAPRPSLPLKIGLVKALVPGVEVAGLTRDPSDRQPRRGASGRAFPTRDGGFVWALAVASEDAGAIRLHVEDMSLPRNAALYVYSRSGEAHGPYIGDGPNGTGEFWTTAVFGGEAILQVRLTGPVAEADLRDVSFRVMEAGFITPGFARVLHASPPVPQPEVGICGNQDCLVDATCVNGTPADPAKNAVAKMEWAQGAWLYTCTGGLIADNNPAQNNYFLTAHHCVSKSNTAQNIDFYWRFATSSCNGACPDNNGWPYITTGSAVRKAGRKGDFSLLQLNSNPPSGSVFLGWTTAPVANSNGTDLWRISNPNFGTQVYSQHDVDTGAGTCAGWPRGERIYSRDIVGAIDGGSSGSPIVNGASQIVGQLSGTCGLSPSEVCASGPGEDNATVDGAFAFYYSLVQPFINP